MSARVGVIADTHGLIRAEALEALAGSDHIVHAGDVGDPDVLAALARIAPVTAVRGNNDRGAWASQLAHTEVLAVESTQLFVLHDLSELEIDPVAAAYQAVITGHAHHPAIETRDGVLYLNPGSAGPRRFDLPVAVARLEVDGHAVEAEIVHLTY
jgi:putative phosphoesterase